MGKRPKEQFEQVNRSAYITHFHKEATIWTLPSLMALPQVKDDEYLRALNSKPISPKYNCLTTSRYLGKFEKGYFLCTLLGIEP